jgi:hypothetical protein
MVPTPRRRNLSANYPKGIRNVSGSSISHCDMALATLGAVLSMLWLRLRPAKVTMATAKPSMW